jgi:hypothetical protein
MLKDSYWNHRGTYQAAAKQLEQLIPAEGSVENPRSTNRALEKFRRAANCYYDLYNNGLGNRASEFRQVFGIASTHYSLGRCRFERSLYRDTEREMDSIIAAAAVEQGIEIVAEVDTATA